MSHLHQRNGVYYIEFSQDNRTTRWSLRTRDARIARQKQREIDSALLGDRANGRDSATLGALVDDYLSWAAEYYRRPDSTPTGSIHRARQALSALSRTMLAVDFGPCALRTIRDAWAASGLARVTVNDYTAVVKHLFKWACARERIPVTAYQALQLVETLHKGRSAALDPDPVRPVTQAHVDAVRPFVPPAIWALIQLQLYTAARSGELVTLRPIDVDRSGAVWTAELAAHKTMHVGRRRVLYFGPKAQSVLHPLLFSRNPTDYLFDPRESVHAAQAAQRGPNYDKYPSYRNRPPHPHKTARTLGPHYTTASYRHAVERACTAAGIPAWTPHRLRHTAATRIRKEFGLEAAQVVLGHATADVTQLYAEADAARAVHVMVEMG